MSEMIKVKSMITVSEVEGTVSVPAYSPEQIKRAYEFPCGYEGTGSTIAIVVAYGNPNIMNDVQVFNNRFNLPPADIEIVYPQGQPEFVDPNWQEEASLDVEWSHALAPKAKILMVVAKDNSGENLFGAVTYAINAGATIISMSWGGVETEDIIQYESIFKNAEGVVFIAASGDEDMVTYPATSAYVVGVGGTSMQLNQCGDRIRPEIAWYFSGGGISTFIEKQSWQYIKNCATPKTNMRTSPDISFFADVFPGVPIYVTPVGSEQGQWITVGGTSVSAPCQAAIFALAIPPGQKLYEPLEVLYELAGECCYTNPYRVYRDIRNGNTERYPALEGLDYVTGLGSPHVGNFIKIIRSLISSNYC